MPPIIGNIVFLFGAGASKGSTHVLPEAPPVMPELYDRLACRFPSEWGAASRRAVNADRYKTNFEQAFTEIDLGQDPSRPPGVPGAPGLMALEAQRPLAVFFSEFHLDGTRKDLYSRLLRYLQGSHLLERCFFSTLNYECLFEQACSRAGFTVNYLLAAAAAMLNATAGPDWPGSRGSSDTIYLAKIHGSCNFIARFDLHTQALLSASNTQVEVSIDPRDPCATLSKTRDEVSVMTQTSRDRHNFLASSQIFQLSQMWNQAVTNAALVVIVGAASRQYDTHIVAPLRGTNAGIAFIGGRADVDSWREINPRVHHLGDTFERAFCRLARYLAGHKRRPGGSWHQYVLDIVRAWVVYYRP
jgi:hypothetical protein